MMLYLDMRYASIIGHEGILRFLPLFGEFRDAIEVYCQKDRLYFDHQGNRTLVPGLNELPFNICAFIDGTIDPILVPFSGPAGDYEGAPRRPQYIFAQESVYTGYKKMHGHKMDTVFFPNGISTCFGPVSAQQNDRGTLNVSGLDRFLVLIQAHLLPHMQCMVFGNSVYRGNALQMVTSYYRALPPDVLTPSELKCSAALRAARMPIEKITAFRAVCRDSVILGEDRVMARKVPTQSRNFASVTSSSTATYASMGTKPAEPIYLHTLHLALTGTSTSRNGFIYE
jgi:hypothetical protein